MTIHLSGERERLVRSFVQGGRFASEDEVIDEALRLLRQREDAEQARVLEGIRHGIEDMKAGRSRPADEVFADIRREFNLSPDA
jgi:antitoxin ParD1/3/4